MSDNHDTAIAELRQSINELSARVGAATTGSFAETSRLEQQKQQITALEETVAMLKAVLENETKATKQALARFATKQDVSKMVGQATESIVEVLTDTIVDSEKSVNADVMISVKSELSALSHKADLAHNAANGSVKAAETLLRTAALKLTL